MRLKKYLVGLSVEVLLGVLLFFSPSSAFTQAPFYQGKTITLIQGRDAGGLGDLRTRALMPFLHKYIPGNPHIVTEYITGGGGRRLANHMYKSVRPDGLTIGNVGAGFLANAVLGEAGVQYDIDKFIYLGSGNSETSYVFFSRREAGLDTLEKLRSAPGVRISAQSVGHDIYIMGRLFAWLLDLKEPKFVAGYTTPEMDAALVRGEIDARPSVSFYILKQNPDWVEKGLMHFHSIVEIPKGLRHPRFAKLPELETFSKTDMEKRILQLIRNLRLVGSPSILPPGTPKERVEILQGAFRRAFKDLQFQEAWRNLAGEPASPLMPEEQAKAVREIPRDREVIELSKKIASGEPLPPR